MGFGRTKTSRGPGLKRDDLYKSGPESSSIMSKFVYAIGSTLLWLLAASGIVWWGLTAVQVYEVQWAALACAVIALPVLFAAYVLQRIWTWIWVSSNSRKAVARRLTSLGPITTDRH